jgi:hypothetical protein
MVERAGGNGTGKWPATTPRGCTARRRTATASGTQRRSIPMSGRSVSSLARPVPRTDRRPGRPTERQPSRPAVPRVRRAAVPRTVLGVGSSVPATWSRSSVEPVGRTYGMPQPASDARSSRRSCVTQRDRSRWAFSRNCRVEDIWWAPARETPSAWSGKTGSGTPCRPTRAVQGDWHDDHHPHYWS